MLAAGRTSCSCSPTSTRAGFQRRLWRSAGGDAQSGRAGRDRRDLHRCLLPGADLHPQPDVAADRALAARTELLDAGRHAGLGSADLCPCAWRGRLPDRSASGGCIRSGRTSTMALPSVMSAIAPRTGWGSPASVWGRFSARRGPAAPDPGGLARSLAMAGPGQSGYEVVDDATTEAACDRLAELGRARAAGDATPFMHDGGVHPAALPLRCPAADYDRFRGRVPPPRLAGARPADEHPWITFWRAESLHRAAPMPPPSSARALPTGRWSMRSTPRSGASSPRSKRRACPTPWSSMRRTMASMPASAGCGGRTRCTRTVPGCR